MTVGYYQRTIPSNRNATPYRHTYTIGRRADSELLLTDHQPPDEIVSLYPNIIILGQGRGTLNKIQFALKKVSKYIGPEGTLITGIGLPPMVVGALTRSTWIVDIYDDPIQTSTINPNSFIHKFSAAIQCKSLKFSELSIITQHPNTPISAYNETAFLMNGAPTELVEPGSKQPREPLRCVIAGKTRLDQGMEMTLQTIRLTNFPVELNVFGEKNPRTVQYSKKLGISDQVKFYGKSKLDKVYEYLSTGHVGFCLLPRRRDWDYAYPLKIGEYLAAGVLPVITPRPGIRKLTGPVGRFCESPEQAAEELKKVSQLNNTEYLDLVEKLRSRAEKMRWKGQMEKFNSLIDNAA